MPKMLTDRKADAKSSPVTWPGGEGDFIVSGTFGGATVQLLHAPLGESPTLLASYTAHDEATNLTEPGKVLFLAGEGHLAVRVLEGTGLTNVNAWVLPTSEMQARHVRVLSGTIA